ncbi:MAG TPA: hypothetical protein VGK74_27490 [Symbiobacteriaceae bacterium]
MQGNIRRARPADVPFLVELSEQKRLEYEQYQPVFWRRAEDARERQEPFFESQVKSERVIAMVHEHRGVVDGFVIGVLVTAPPVYAPGGYICSIDDYMVADPDDWETIGAVLLKEVCREARRRGAVLVNVVSGHEDGTKRAMLAEAGFTIASEWHVKPIAED